MTKPVNAGVLATQNQADISALKGRVKRYSFSNQYTVAPNVSTWTPLSITIPDDETIIGAYLITGNPTLGVWFCYNLTKSAVNIGLKNLSTTGETITTTVTVYITTIKDL